MLTMTPALFVFHISIGELIGLLFWGIVIGLFFSFFIWGKLWAARNAFVEWKNSPERWWKRRK